MRHRQRARGGPAALAVCVWTVAVWMAASAHGPCEAAAADSAPLTAHTLLAVADTVLARHVNPPTRQEMVLSAARAICARAAMPVPIGLGRRISELDEAGLRDLLADLLRQAADGSQVDTRELRDVGVAGLFRAVPGAGHLVPLAEHSVQQQLRENRYVGIGIQLGAKDGYPVMMRVFPRGPARRAGGRNGDRMISIDGIPAKGMPLSRVVELLRGQEGKPTTVVVRQPGSGQDRTLDMVRGVVPFDTVLGAKRISDEEWNHRVQGEPPVAYVKLESIRASTPLELRQVAGRLHAEGCRALVVDLRGTQAGDIRHAAMVADELLGAGPLGTLVRTDGETRFESNAHQLFPGWPLAVLIDKSTRGQAEWLAAALRDRGGATLVGTATAGYGLIEEMVELPEQLGAVQLVTGILQQPDGKRLFAVDSWPTQLNAPLAVVRSTGGRLELAPRAHGTGLVPDQESANSASLSEAIRLLSEALDES